MEDEHDQDCPCAECADADTPPIERPLRHDEQVIGCELYVQNLHEKSSERFLTDRFEVYGNLLSVRLLRRAHNIIEAFLRFSTPQEAEFARKSTDGHLFFTKRLVVSIATPADLERANLPSLSPELAQRDMPGPSRINVNPRPGPPAAQGYYRPGLPRQDNGNNAPLGYRPAAQPQMGRVNQPVANAQPYDAADVAAFYALLTMPNGPQYSTWKDGARTEEFEPLAKTMLRAMVPEERLVVLRTTIELRVDTVYNFSIDFVKDEVVRRMMKIEHMELLHILDDSQRLKRKVHEIVFNIESTRDFRELLNLNNNNR